MDDDRSLDIGESWGEYSKNPLLDPIPSHQGVNKVDLTIDRIFE
jgi:hypothetical protein